MASGARAEEEGEGAFIKGLAGQSWMIVPEWAQFFVTPRSLCCTQRRQARQKIARYGPEASVSEPKGKCRESCDQESTLLP